MERSVYKMLSKIRLPETRVCLVFAVLTTFLIVLNKHLIKDPVSQNIKPRNMSVSALLDDGTTYSDDAVDALFVEKHCDLQGVDWYPEDDVNEWQQRAPYFFLIGGERTESSALANALRHHPQISSASFSLPTFSRGKIPVKDARSALYNQTMSDVGSDVLGFGRMPDYLLHGTAPYSTLCICPWVKIVILIQHPIDRILSSWRHYKQKSKSQISFEEWIDADMTMLRQAGVVKDWNSTEEFELFSKSPQLELAWHKYIAEQKGQYNHRPIGRSLYSIQLRNWFHAVRQVGQDPEETFLIVRVEDIETNPAALYEHLIRWLELPPYLNATFPNLIKHNNQSNDMNEATRKRLQQFFKPYNEQTYDILQGQWKGLWDETTKLRDRLVIWPTFVEPQKDDESTIISNSLPTNSADGHQSEASSKPIPTEVPLESQEPRRKPDTVKRPTTKTSFQNRSHHMTPELPNNLTGTDAWVAQWCDLQGDVLWYPNKTHVWQLRAPYFIVMGAKWSGATLLTSCIMQHPLIAKATSPAQDFFLTKNFRKFISLSGKTKVLQARASMYARHYRQQSLLKSNSSLVSFDSTPGYLFFVSQIQRILCVAPWAKFIVVLRNPVEHAYAIWSEAVSLGLKTSFDDWITADIKIMQDVGLVRDWHNESFDTFAGSQNEEDAWLDYQQRVQEGAIGRGLYEIQLRQWFSALEAIGRNPKTECLILRAESLSRNAQREFSRILSFLKLPDNHLVKGTKWASSHYSKDMAKSTRRTLETFYAPYNKRLFTLLGDEPNWGGKWKGWQDAR